VLEGASALAVAMALCCAGSELATALGVAGASISVITALTVALASAAPRALRPLVPSAEGLACIILQARARARGARRRPRRAPQGRLSARAP